MEDFIMQLLEQLANPGDGGGGSMLKSEHIFQT